MSKTEADARLSRLRRQVSLQVFTLRYEDSTCREARQTALELAEATSRLSVEVSDVLESGDLVRKYRVASCPAIVASAKAAPEVRFYGVPHGFGLIGLLDCIVALGAMAESRADLVSALEPLAEKSLCPRIELLVSRRDGATVESCAALVRMVVAAAINPDMPQPIVSIRFIEDFPQFAAALQGPDIPALFVDAAPVLTWPFTDHDIATALVAGAR